MNILILNPILRTAENGVIPVRESNRDTMAYSLARGAVELGHRVTLAVAEEFKPLLPECNSFEVVYFKSRFHLLFPPHLLPYSAGLAKYLRKNGDDFDMIITSEAFSLATLIAVIFQPRKALIWQELAMHQRKFYSLPSKLWYNLLCRIMMRSVLTVGRSIAARNFIGRYIKATKTETVDHGADSSLFYPGHLREDYFIVVSQLIKRKCIDRIITSFAHFVQRPERSDWRLIIVGDGDLRNELMGLASNLGISRHTEFKGFMSHSEMAPIQRKATAMLIDTAQDLNMVSVCEAMANGVPVVMNTVPTSSFFVQSEHTGLAKDNWGADELEEVVERYDEFHANCIRIRERLTDKGCVTQLINSFLNHKKINRPSHDI